MSYDPNSFRERAGTSLTKAYIEKLEDAETEKLIRIVRNYEENEKEELARVRAMPRVKRFFHNLFEIFMESAPVPDPRSIEYSISKNILQERQFD